MLNWTSKTEIIMEKLCSYLPDFSEIHTFVSNKTSDMDLFISNLNTKNPKIDISVVQIDLNDLEKLSLEDGCATLSMLTVKSICMAINSLDKIPNTILLSGGGRKNEFIVNNIKKILNTNIFLIDEFNFDGDYIESQAFAYLAIRSYLKKFITFPSTTGVKKPCSGGLIFKS